MAPIVSLFTSLAPVLSGISAGVGIASGIKALTSKDKSSPPPKPEPLPPPPTPAKAQETAAEKLAKRRRISLLSGGDTNKTRGQALVPEVNIGRKSLLGE